MVLRSFGQYHFSPVQNFKSRVLACDHVSNPCIPERTRQSIVERTVNDPEQNMSFNNMSTNNAPGDTDVYLPSEQVHTYAQICMACAQCPSLPATRLWRAVTRDLAFCREIQFQSQSYKNEYAWRESGARDGCVKRERANITA